jgi:hypothetical protein
LNALKRLQMLENMHVDISPQRSGVSASIQIGNSRKYKLQGNGGK